MARRIGMSVLDASTLDILNTIRQNASYEYQSSVPLISSAHEIPRVGQVIYGYPNLANQFVSSLVNRIALVRINAAIFNNAYKMLKKGFLEYGETVEEAFVCIVKAREFSPEKAEARELKRSLPDIRTAFHSMNWRVQYPVTIQDEDLKQAFLSIDGVQDLIARVINQVTVSAEYDEFLLFKYLLIKAISHGKMYPVSFDASTAINGGSEYRGYSNLLTFMKPTFNESHVHTVTKRDDQYIFMDAAYNGKYDVEVLASAFNMDKATFLGHLVLIDDWVTFDNDRFSEIRANSDMIEEVTADELALMANVKAVLVDQEWFQVYDKMAKFTEKYVASGLYWNYFYNSWKIVSHSPYSNAVVFVDDGATTTLPETINFTVDSVVKDNHATIVTLAHTETNSVASSAYNFVQDEAATTAGIAVHRYGAVIFPEGQTTITLELDLAGTPYYAQTALTTSSAVGTTIAFKQTKASELANRSKKG